MIFKMYLKYSTRLLTALKIHESYLSMLIFNNFFMTAFLRPAEWFDTWSNYPAGFSISNCPPCPVSGDAETK